MKRSVGFGAAVLLALLAGCSEQAEGDRCDLDNGGADCKAGLVCKSLESLNRSGGGAICCPDGNATVAACRPGSVNFEDDPNFSEDTSTQSSADAQSSTPPSPTTEPNVPLFDAAVGSPNVKTDAAPGVAADAATDAGDAGGLGK